jgi:hypothetical protein
LLLADAREYDEAVLPGVPLPHGRDYAADDQALPQHGGTQSKGGNAMLQVHAVLSLIGIVSGLVVLYGLLTNNPFGGWTAVFLGTTVLTSVTGFLLPPFGFDPARAMRT